MKTRYISHSEYNINKYGDFDFRNLRHSSCENFIIIKEMIL